MAVAYHSSYRRSEYIFYSDSFEMSDGELEAVFNSFCAFGAGTKGGPAMMDNSKFNKLFKDLKLYTKSFTSTDTDIIFNRTEVKA